MIKVIHSRNVGRHRIAVSLLLLLDEFYVTVTYAQVVQPLSRNIAIEYVEFAAPRLYTVHSGLLMLGSIQLTVGIPSLHKSARGEARNREAFVRFDYGLGEEVDGAFVYLKDLRILTEASGYVWLLYVDVFLHSPIDIVPVPRVKPNGRIIA